MVLLTYCLACRRGEHDRCQGVMQAVPKGMMGGVRCRCEGECATRRKAAQTSPEGPTMDVALRPQDADAILALAEWALNQPALDMGPGLHPHMAEEACRRIEAVADLHRRGVPDA